MPIGALGVGSLVNAGLNTAAFITGLVQNRKRRKFGEQQLAEAEKNKPEFIPYTIPKAVDEYSNYIKGLSREGLPGERVIADQMGAAYAGAQGGIERAADSSAAALGASTNLQGRYLNSVRDLGVQSAQVKAQNERDYAMQNANAALTRADYDNMAFQYNVANPYSQGMNRYDAQKNAAYQNIFGAADASTAGLVDYGSSLASGWNSYQNMLPYQYGGGMKKRTNPNLPNYGPADYPAYDPMNPVT